MAASIIDVIMNRRLAAAYQKVFRLADGAVVGHEGLARGAESPLEAPAVLFAEAERLGLAKDLDLLCLQTVLSLAPRDGLIFVNLRPSTALWLAARPDLTAGFLAGRPAASVVLELTELDRVGRVEEFARAAAVLKNLGFGLALDDLAWGYNRLELLTVLRPGYIKLDEPFTGDCHLHREKRAAIAHLLALAADLGARTIAEHIEKAGELEALKDLDVKYGQGFYLVKPERRDGDGTQVDKNAASTRGLPARGGKARPLA